MSESQKPLEPYRRRYPITDTSILQCVWCGKQETGLQARTRIQRHPDDAGREHAECLSCGGAQIPITSSDAPEPIEKPTQSPMDSL